MGDGRSVLGHAIWAPLGKLKEARRWCGGRGFGCLHMGRRGEGGRDMCRGLIERVLMGMGRFIAEASLTRGVPEYALLLDGIHVKM